MRAKQTAHLENDHYQNEVTLRVRPAIFMAFLQSKLIAKIEVAKIEGLVQYFFGLRWPCSIVHDSLPFLKVDICLNIIDKGISRSFKDCNKVYEN